MAVARTDYWNPNESDSEEDSEPEVEETLADRVKENSKRLYTVTTDWTKWGWKTSKKWTFEICAHTFFLALPFTIVIMQHTLDAQKWEHTLNVAREDIQKETMIKMGDHMKNVAMPPTMAGRR